MEIRKASFLWIALLGMVMAVATFLENAHSSVWALENIYRSWWFVLLWAIGAILMGLVSFKSRLWRRLPVFLLHVSFLVILLGALLTHLTGREGVIHIREGETLTRYFDKESMKERDMTFSLMLNSFEVECYPGTDTPSDYVSCVVLDGKDEHTISMNNILEVDGYRLYQSSFDEDEKGSYLSVSYDPWGTPVTYLGYLLFGFSFLWMMIARRETFLSLARSPLLAKGVAAVLLVLFPAASAMAEGRNLPVLGGAAADSIARVQVIYNGRVAPFDTQARELLQKVYGKDSYQGLSAVRVLGGWLLRPDVWDQQPLIKIKSAELRRRLGVSGSHVSLNDLYDDGDYRLEDIWQKVRDDQAQANLSDAIMEVDEKVGLILMLQNGTLIEDAPKDGSVELLSDSRVSMELLYNAVPLTKILFMTCMTLGMLSLVCMVLHMIGKRRDRGAVDRLLDFALYAVLAFQIVNYLGHWYLCGRMPLGNGYETMLFLALTALVLAALLQRRLRFMNGFGLLLAGFTLLVAFISQKTPQITPLMPVLSSPLLTLHVSVIMLSYALLALCTMCGALAIFLQCSAIKRGKDFSDQLLLLTLVSRMMLYPAMLTLGAGIFLGAVWANVSWGTYWSWDPKEVWALITMLVYAVPFHRQSLPAFQDPGTWHRYMVLAFLTILMTYFGCNYLLTGLHSYVG